MTRRESNTEGTPREREVRSLFAEMKASGQTLTKFCEQRGIPRGTLSCWGTVIRRRDAARAGSKNLAIASVPDTTAPAAPRFVRVRVRSRRPTTTRGGSPLEVVTPGGLTVRVPVGFDAATLTALLGVLEAGRC